MLTHGGRRRWLSLILVLAGLALLAVPARFYVRAQLRLWLPGPDVTPVAGTESEIEQAAPESGATEEAGVQQASRTGPWRIYIPKINLGVPLIDGTSVEDLKQGPGVYPQGVKPGESGNLCIAGHRNAYGCEFWHLDKLRPEDKIYITVGDIAYSYEVERLFVIARNDWSVIEPTGYDALTLTTCHPLGSTEQRLIVRARLTATVTASRIIRR